MTRPSTRPTTRRYSPWTLIREGLRGHTGWAPAWRFPDPQPFYDIVVIGGGGHGLATAYYLAKTHRLRRVAVIEKGWLGGGNTGRNTTVIRSNYYFPESAALYDFSLRLYEGLTEEINYNVMVSQRGHLQIAHSEHDLEVETRLANAMAINGVPAEILTREQVLKDQPLLNHWENSRFPIYGGITQRRAGTARHDAVAWGYARAADALGVDILQNCEVLGFEIAGNQIQAINTSRGRIGCARVGLCAAGHTSHITAMAGFRVPLHSYTLQAFVSEPVKPLCNRVIISSATGMYVSQSDKGELVFGGGLDRVPSYSQRGTWPAQHDVVAGMIENFPTYAQLRLLRQWGGIVDVSPDSSPILGPTPVENLFINCGWGTGGFKAIPGGGFVLAHILVTGSHHPLSAPFGLDRFATGAWIDESAGAGIPH